jgi:Rieske 2Fe-2S family protein
MPTARTTIVPAPIDPARLQGCLRGIAESRTLPAEAYLSPEVFDWEQETFFERSWVCVGRDENLRNPGDQTATRIGAEGILLVRGQDGELRAFYNSCRHRGHELLECGASTNFRVIKCPYHAWVYGLDGVNRAAPRFSEIPSFDNADFPLIPARVVEWHGWIFVNASGDANEFAEHIGNLEGHIANFEAERLFTAAGHEYEVRANWKTITENYHECYHCPSIHPELCVVTPPDSGRNYEHTGAWVGGDMELKDFAETMSLTGESKGVAIRGLDDYQRRTVLYVGLLPNLLLSLHPDYIMTHRFEPLGPDRTRVECNWLFPPEAKDRTDFDPSYASSFWDITNKQDWLACESVARGLASRGNRQGPFSYQEDEVHQFMGMVARGYLDGHISVRSFREGAHGRGAAVPEPVDS